MHFDPSSVLARLSDLQKDSAVAIVIVAAIAFTAAIAVLSQIRPPAKDDAIFKKNCL